MSQPTPLRLDHVPIVAEQWADIGPPIVLLHAGVCDRRSWYPTAEPLSECGRVIVYDRRGFGDSPVSTESFRHVDDLLALLDHLGEPAQLVGSSMGGEIALDAALLRPDVVRGLVLLAPAVSGTRQPEVSELDPHTQRLIELIQGAQDLADLNRLLTWMWLDGPASAEGRVPGAARDLMFAMNDIILRNNVPDTAGEGNLDAWNQLEDMTIPVTVAWGDLDVPFTVDQCQQLVQRIPHAQAHVLPGRAHLPYLEDPAGVAELICHAG